MSTSFCLVLASMHFGHWQLSLSCRGERAEGRLFGGAVAGWLLWGRGEVTRWYCGRIVAVGEGERSEGRTVVVLWERGEDSGEVIQWRCWWRGAEGKIFGGDFSR